MKSFKQFIKEKQLFLESYKLSKKWTSKEAKKVIDLVIKKLQQFGLKSNEILIGGSYRRKKPEVGDIDFGLISSKVNRAFYENFLNFISEEYRIKKLRLGDKLCSFVLDTNPDNVNKSESELTFDIPSSIVVEFSKGDPQNPGALLLKITGSGKFNQNLRVYALLNGFKLNEYGLFKQDGTYVAGKTEQDIFKALGLKYIPPEKRTDHYKFPKKKKEKLGTIDYYDAKALLSKVPKNILNKVPQEAIDRFLNYQFPKTDEYGTPIPEDFWWNKKSRQNHYRRGGKYRVPEHDLKLDTFAK